MYVSCWCLSSAQARVLNYNQSHETVPNIKISDFQTFLGAEAIQKVVSGPHCNYSSPSTDLTWYQVK